MVLKRFNTNNAWFSIAGMGSFLIKKQVDTRYRTQFIAPPVIPNSAKIPKQIPNYRAIFRKKYQKIQTAKQLQSGIFG